MRVNSNSETFKGGNATTFQRPSASFFVTQGKRTPGIKGNRGRRRKGRPSGYLGWKLKTKAKEQPVNRWFRDIDGKNKQRESKKKILKAEGHYQCNIDMKGLRLNIEPDEKIERMV